VRIRTNTSPKPMRDKVFIDTSAFYASLNRKDIHHQEALRLFERAAQERWVLVTSNFVVAETHALILHRLGASAAREWLEKIPARVERATEEDERRAVQIIFSYPDKDFTLCDAISFVLMERLRIGKVMSFDRHFEQYGRFMVLKV